MADFMIAADMPHHIHHTLPHAVAHAKAVAPVIKQGYSMLTLLISNLLTAGIFGGGAWYVRGRGVNGVKNDLNNAKAEIEKLTRQTQAGVAAAQAVA